MTDNQEHEATPQTNPVHEGSDFARGQREEDLVTPTGADGGDFAAGQETSPHQNPEHSDFARGQRAVDDTEEDDSDFARGQRTSE
ncbi:MAG: hypothetical protein U0822_06025 [Anaerolineae bacterium]